MASIGVSAIFMHDNAGSRTAVVMMTNFKSYVSVAWNGQHVAPTYILSTMPGASADDV